MRPFDDGRVHVHGEKEVGVVLIGNCRSLIERDDDVVVPGQDHPRLQLRLERGGKPAAERQRRLFLHQPGRTDGTDLLAAVAGVDDDGVDAGRFDRLRRRERLRRPRARCRAFAKIENDPERVLEPIGVADDVRRGELDAQVVADERGPGNVRIVVGLLDIGCANATPEPDRVRARLLDDGVIGRRGERQDDFRDALHVGDGDLHGDRGRLRRMHLKNAPGRVPRHVERRGADQESLEKLPRHERPVVDRDRRHRHFDQLVLDHPEPAVGTEGGHGVAERGLEAVTLVRYRSAERGHRLVGGEVGLAILVRDGDDVIAVRRAQGGLIGRVRRRGGGGGGLSGEEQCGKDCDRQETERTGHGTKRVTKRGISHRDLGIIARRIRLARALGASPSART